MPGVVATAVGYTGGSADHPTYEMVCRGGTGHAEAVLVEFDPRLISYQRLLESFWSEHSPTYERKGQYRSAVFVFDAEQASEAAKSRQEIERKLGQRVITEVKPVTTFWLAEEYHQQYYDKSGIFACPSR